MVHASGRLDLELTADNEQPLEPEAAKTMKLTLESRPVFSDATCRLVGYTFALDGKQPFHSGHRVITQLQCSTARLKTLKSKRSLLSGVNNDDRFVVGRVTKAT